MDDEDNDYELERQKTIAENRLLLDSLGLDPSGASKIPHSHSKPSSTASKTKTKSKPNPKKRKAFEAIDDGPRRRSGRLAGLEADGEALKIKLEEEEKEREVLRIVSRKERERVMDVVKMVEDTPEDEIKDLERYLSSIAVSSVPRRFPSTSTSAKEAYADNDSTPAEVQRLKSAFRNMELKANAKVTSERVFSMVVHPERTKNLVLVGDKYGQLGIWDALGPPMEKVESEDDTSGVKEEEDGEQDHEGRVWRVQAHARNSITCMKVDPVNGSGLFSSSYDCSLRHLSFSTLKSTEIFAFSNENMLVTHFDLTPSGQEAWIADKNGGLSHCDFRESKRERERRRWIVQEEGRAAKIGGLSVNPLMPHLLVTACNDQHLRIWDVRHLTSIPADSNSAHMPTPPPSAKREKGSEVNVSTSSDSHVTGETEYDKVAKYMSTSKGKGLLRASWQHGKSCSSAYWDPWGRRVLSTSYDDKLRVWSLNPQSLLLDSPLAPSHFQPSKQIPHNCQTGRWLTILRAQWSLNMDYMPHFTVGNMKRSLDVIAASGEKIVSVWNEAVTAVPAVTASHPSLVDRVVGGNTSGRIQLWGAGDS
ncbi:WD repeat-containing protein [Kwoniella heveanensis CBS 569]|nr:WD repeat-containing protein [Kwoniella heveanensis CBS 569]